ncbi:MAG TPA: acyltransferase [Jatrophihabitans sp.]|uniref:acyltransferase family protein n=1 Tax=Jatrophihabitans sp. TaxID=1932789 RepID=UPI002E0CA332|nr:acyltransferase [Jatrophihabitans sp.]
MSRRTRQGTDHVGGLDGARAIAAYGVIATHAGFNTGRSLDHGPFAPLLARLDFGVTIFFLLSGYLLYRPFARSAIRERPAPRLGPFWWRRALRILPAYWLAVVVTLALLSDRRGRPSDWFSYLSLVQTYNHHDVDTGLVQMWTLVVEVAFYAALPLLAMIPRLAGRASPVRAHVSLLIGMAVVALGADLVTHTVTAAAPAQLWLPAYLDWFALGMFLAVASCVPVDHARWRRALDGWATSPGTCWIAGALTFWLATLPLAGPYNLIPATTWEWTLKHYLYGAAAFFFLLPVMLGDPRAWSHRLLSHAVLRRLGEISYGVYLWHLPLLIFIQHRMHWRVFGGHFLPLFVLTCLGASAAAAGSYYVLERPLLRRFSRPWRRGGQQRDQQQGDGEEAQHLDRAGVGEGAG